MKHARQKIREAVETSLSAIGGVTITRSRVHPKMSLPAIDIRTLSESSDLENDQIPSPRRYSRRVILEVDITVSAVSDYDDLADDYAAQVEAILGADTTLTSTCTDSKLISTATEDDGDQEKPIAVTRLAYECWYRTTSTDAETPL